ncbi:2-hydroxyacid dehydrogenase [Jiulongibacter sp. NS-SX5]|uniref:2-hydroxyacid dehydrogenase n=1 Tax=Jiulongibacter sp. NS-SX5 TaxID=3463854 RepID=UPI0040583D46
MKKVLLLESLAEEAMEILHNSKDLEVLKAFDFDLTHINTQEVEAVITRGKGQITPEFLDLFPQLKAVARAGVGLDNVDIPYASQKGVKVLNNPGVNSQTVAEHTIALILMLQRKMYDAVKQVKENNWPWRNKFNGDEVYEKTLGIIGMGTIGQKVAKIAEAMGMKIIYFDPNIQYLPYAYGSLEEVLAVADVVTLHVPLFDATRHLINLKTLSLMKPQSILINTARGPIVNETAVLKALQKGQLGGYAADVMTLEPPSDNNPLIALPNVLLTAHLASLTKRTYNKMCVDAVNNIIAILNGDTPMQGCVFNETQIDQNL